MKAYIDIPKPIRTGCRRSAAIIDAVRSSCLDWTIDDVRPLELLGGKRHLRELLKQTCAELNDRRGASFSDLEALGMFDWLDVEERRGYWRVSAEVERAPMVVALRERVQQVAEGQDGDA